MRKAKIIETKEMHNVRVVSVGCMGSCFMEPIVQVSMPDRETILYGKMTKDKVSELIQKVIVEKGYLSEDLIKKTNHHLDAYIRKYGY